MSLINEALKRAKRTQPSAPSAEGPALRPADPARPEDEGPGLLLPLLIGVVLVLACILLWQWFHTGATAQVRARSSVVEVNPAAAPTPAAVPVAATLPVPAANLLPTSADNSAADQVIAVEPGATNAVAVPTAKPQPPAYKLQGIFYRPKNP